MPILKIIFVTIFQLLVFPVILETDTLPIFKSLIYSPVFYYNKVKQKHCMWYQCSSVRGHYST